MGVLDWTKTAARDVALTPFAGLYALGGTINTVTGGQTQTYSIWEAARGGGSTQEQTSTLVRAASLVRGEDLNGDRSLRLQAPLLNPAGGELAGDLIEDVAGFAGDAAGGAARGLGVGGMFTIAALAAGGLFIATRGR